MRENDTPTPTIGPDDAEEYTAALGQVFSGAWRQIELARRLGVPRALGMTTEEWVRERLGGYVRLSIEERREAVKELADEGLSNRQIATVLGVDEGSVRNDKRATAESSAEPAPMPATDKYIRLDDAESSAPATRITRQSIPDDLPDYDHGDGWTDEAPESDDEPDPEAAPEPEPVVVNIDLTAQAAYQRAIVRKNIADAFAIFSDRIGRIKPETIAELADAELSDYVVECFPEPRRWMDRVEEALAPRIRRVK